MSTGQVHEEEASSPFTLKLKENTATFTLKYIYFETGEGSVVLAASLTTVNECCRKNPLL